MTKPQKQFESSVPPTTEEEQLAIVQRVSGLASASALRPAQTMWTPSPRLRS